MVSETISERQQKTTVVENNNLQGTRAGYAGGTPGGTTGANYAQPTVPASAAAVNSVTPTYQQPAPQPQIPAVPQQPVPVRPPRKPRDLRKTLKLVGLILLILLLLLAGWLIYGNLTAPKKSQTNDDIAKRFNAVQIPLSDLAADGDLSVIGTRSLTINGAVRANSAFILSPSGQPSNANRGQIYYDTDSNQLAYYNGSEFVTLTDSTSSSVQNIGGFSGTIVLGDGLTANNNQLTNTGVLSVQGQTGNVVLTSGGGLAIDGTTLTNTGVLSVGGQTGAIGVGNGLGVAGGTLTNEGVVSLAAGSLNLVITDDGAGNLTISDVGGGSGTVASPGGTAGRIAKFTGVQTIEDSLLSESGATVTVNGNLAVTGSLSLSTPLSVSNGGTGATSLANNGVVVGAGSGALTAVATGTPGLCLVSTAGAPIWDNCSGSTGVTSLNGLAGALTVANASATGSTITIDDASTTQKGIAQFNGSNFSASGGVINTIQNIGTGASPTFANQTLSGDLAVNGGDITSSGALNVAAGTAFTLQGNASSVINATSGVNTTTLAFQSPTANVTYRFATATAGTYDICTMVGNCAGVGGGVTTSGGTTGRIAKFTGSQAIGDSLLAEAGSTVTVSGNLNITTGSQFQVNGTQISSANLSNDANLAKLNAAQTFIGNTNTFRNGANSTTAFSVQNAASARVLTVDTTNGEVELGTGGTLGGSLVFNNSANTNTITLVGATATANRTITLPNDSGTVCLSTGNCAGAGVTLQSAYNNSSTPEITVDATRGALTIRDASTPIGANLLEVQNNAGNITYFAVSSSGTSTTGSSTASGNINSSGGALQTNGTTRVDNSGNLTNIGSLTLSGAISGGTTYSGSGNINTTGGSLQTNSTTRIDNSGNLLNIGNLTATGAITVASTGAGNDIVLNSADTIELQDNTNVTGNFDVSGTLAVGTGNAFQVAAGGDVTSAGNATLQGGTVTIGTTSQSGLLSLSDGSSNTGSLQVAALSANRTYTLPDQSGTICLSTGNCAGAGVTLQTAYDNSTNPEIILNASNGALTIRDASSALGANLLEVQNNAGSITYLAVTSSGASVTGSVTSTGNVNSSGGTLQTGGTTRVDNSGNLTNIGNLTLSGAISGGTTYSGSGNINTTGGSLQTAGTTRVDNTGNLVNIGNITGSGAITVASSGAGNDITIDGADQFIVQDAATFNALTTFTTDVDLAFADTENLSITSTVTGTNSVNLIGAVLTNNTTSGTQQMALLQNAAGSGTTEGLLVLDNADTDTAVTRGINITSAAGGITTALDVSDADIVTALLFGANDITGTNFSVTGSSGSFTSAGNATIQGGTVTVGTGSQAGSLVINDGSSNTGTIQVAALGQNTVYTLPDPGSGSATICLSTGNCAGAGGGITGSGSTNQLAKFTSSGTVGNSSISDDGTNVTTTVDMVIQGGDITVGTTSQLASLILHDGNGQKTTLQAGDSSTDLTFILPTTAGNANQCLKQSGSGDQLVWDDCDGGSSGSSTTLQGAYNNGNTITTTNARDIDIVLADTATDSNFDLVVADGSTSFVSFARANGSGTADPAQLLVVDNLDTDRALPVGIRLQSAGGGMTTAIDASDAEIVDAVSVGANNIVGTTGNIDFTNFDVAGSTGNVTAGTYNGQTISSAASFTGTLQVAGATTLQTTLAVTGNTTLTGDLAVNGGDITSSGALNITPGGSLVVGAAAQSLTLQGNASTTLTATDSGNTTTVSFQTPTDDVTYRFAATSTGTYDICTTAGNCTGTAVTLQSAYDNGNSITTTNNRNILFSLANTATDANFVVNIADDSTSTAQINRANGTGTNNPAQLLVLDNQDTDQAIANGLVIQSAGGGITDGLDVSDAELVNAINAGDNTIAGGLAVIDFTNFDVASNGNITTAGDVAVNGGDVTSTGALNITPGGALVVGATGQTATFQGSVTTITSNGAGNDIVLNSADTIELQDNTNVTGNADISGTLAVGTANAFTVAAGGDVTSAGNGTLQGGSLTLGTSSQAGSLVLNDGSSNTGSIQVAALGQNVVYTLPDPGSGSATICLSTGNCSGASVTLQAAYDNSTNPEIVVDATRGALTVRDASSAIGANLLEVQSNDGLTTYFGVNATGVAVAGNATISGNATIDGNATIGSASSDTLTMNATIQGSTPFIFEGGTADAHQLSFSIATLTGDRTVTFGDEAGTVCLQNSANCGFATGSAGDYIQNQNSISQSANFRINGTGRADTALQAPLFDTASAGTLSIGTTNATAINLNQNTTITGGTTGDALTVTNSASTGNIAVFKDNTLAVATIADGGAATFKNSVNSVSAFAIQNAATGSLFNVDSANSNITMLANNSGEVGAWQTNANALPASRYAATSVTANGYVYVIGGDSGSYQSTVYYAKLNADGSTGSWSTGNALPALRASAASTVANGYIYVLGGWNSGYANTVYYAKLNRDGSVGTWQTSNNPLPVATQYGETVVANGHIYMIGGETSGGTQSTVYYAKLLGDGRTGSWQTASNPLPAVRRSHKAIVANGYVYVLGGMNASTSQSTVYYARLNIDGTVGTWSTTTALSSGLTDGTATVVNGHMYYIGGSTSDFGTPLSAVRYARLNNDGTLGTWTDAANSLTAARWGGTTVAVNGYIYYLGGYNTAAQSTVYYTSTSRLKVGGNLDLVGYSGQNLADYSESGGSLTAGNGNFIGNLQVQGRANFANDVAINGGLVADTATIRTATNAAQAFQVQNSAGTSIANVSTLTTANLVANPNFELNANGWAVKGSATSLAVSNDFANFGSRSLKFVTGTTSGNGAQYRYQFAPSTQYTVSFWARRDASSANTFNIGRSDNGSDTDCLTGQTLDTTWRQFTCTFTTGATIGVSAHFYLKQTDTTTDTLYIDGATLVTGATALAFSADGENLNVDPVYSRVTLNGVNSGELASWQSSSTLPASRSAAATVQVNGRIYVIAGNDSGGTAQSSVYYSKLNGDGSVASWTTASNSLPAARSNPSAIAANGYIYVLGGWQGSSAQSTIYYARVNSDGSLGTWRTAANTLPAARESATAITANGYVYVLGGYNAGAQSTVYYAKLNSDGSVGTWTTSANALPAVLFGSGAIVANGYAYVLGGANASGVAQTTVYSAKLNADGTTSAWSTLTALPAARSYVGAVTQNGYVYVVGGSNSSAQSTVYYSKLTAGGSLGTWSTAANPLPAARYTHNSAVISNGYIYVPGGTDSAGAATATTYYASASRVLVGGSLDLVGSADSTLNEDGGTGGSITAVNGTFVGGLQVQGQANFASNVSFMGTLAAGEATFQNATDSTGAFKILNASGTDLLSVDTTNSRLQIGSTTADSTGALLVLDTKNTSGDPTGVNGSLYYNSNSNKLRCYENGAWSDCIAGAGSFIQNQNASQQASSNFWISGTGRADTAFQAPLIDTPTAATLNIGTTNATGISLNKATTVTGALNQSGGILSLSGNTSSTVGTTSGTLALQSVSSTNRILISGSSNTMTFDTGSSGIITLGSANTSTVNIGGQTNNARTINIGYQAAASQAQNVNIGAAIGTTAISILGGTGSTAVAISAASGGTVSVGDAGVAGTIQIGNTTGAVAQTISIGNNATASSSTTLTLGSTISTSTTAVRAGTGGLSLLSGANVTIGTSDTTGTLLVLDTKTGSGDPTGVNGGLYYNSNSNKFRCYENGAWTDCITTGGSSPTLQTAYTNSTGGTTPEIMLDATRGGLDIQDNGTSINDLLLAVRASAVSGLGSALMSINSVGVTTFQNTLDSANAFQILTQGSASIFNVDTDNERVGIGGTASASKLEVIGGDAAIYNNGNNPRLVLGDSTSAGQNGFLQWDSLNNYFRIETVGTNGLKVNDNYVSIGNLFPDQPLKVGNGSTLLAQVNTTGAAMFQNSSNSTTAFRVLNAAGSRLLTVDTSNGTVILGEGSAAAGALAFSNVTNGNTISLVSATATADRTITLPNETGTVCTTGSVCTGYAPSSGSGNYINNGTGQQTANFNIVSAAAGNIGAQVQAAASATQPALVVKGGATPGAGGDLLQFQNSANSVLGRVDSSGNLSLNVASPDTSSKIDLVGSISTALDSASYRSYHNVVGYSYNSGAVTGTMKITMPQTWNYTMMRMTIKGYTLNANAAWEVVVSGYNNGSPAGWSNTSVEMTGTPPFTSVRLAHDGTKNVLLLGTTSTSWSYPKITLSEFTSGYVGAAAAWGSGWTMAPITDESAITDSVTPTVKSFMTSGGFLGIGTTAPAAMLSVGASSQFQVSSTGVVTGGTYNGQTISSAASFTGTLAVAGATSLNGNLTVGDANTDTVTFNSVVQGASALVFEGATADANETTFVITDPTADRTITFPNESGTVCTTGSVCTGYAPASGSGNYINNGTGQQTANFNIVSSAAGNVGAQIQGAASATQPVLLVKGGATPGTGGDLLQFQNSANSVLGRVDSSGNLSLNVATPDTGSKIDVGGSIATTLDGGAYRSYHNVVGYSNNNTGLTGTMKITMPHTWNRTMLRMTIKGYNFNLNSGWEVVVSGYNYDTTTTWLFPSVEMRGTPPFTSVRLAHDGTKNVVLLGTTSSTWEIPKITVSEVTTGFTGAAASWGSGWTMGLITDESAIVNVTTPAVRTFMTSSGFLGIGTTAPAAMLSVGASSQFQVSSTGVVSGSTYNGQTISSAASFTGSLAVAGASTFNGNVTLGDNTLDLISFNGVVQGGITFEGATADANETTIVFTDPTGDRTITFPDESGTVCTTGSVCAGYAPASGSANYIQNQNAGQQSSSNFWISGTGRVDTSVLTPLLDTATATALNIGTNNATAINLREATTVQTGANVDGAFKVVNSAGQQLLNLSTIDNTSDLVTNGSIETNSTGWAGKGGASASRATSEQYVGVASLGVTTTATTGDGAKYTVQLSPSTTYTASIYAKLASGTFTNMSIGYSSDGSVETDCKTGESLKTTGWQNINCTFTTAASVGPTAYFYWEQASGTARTVYVDALQIVAGNDIGAYYDGKLDVSGLIFSGGLAVQPDNDSNSAFQVQSSTGATVFGIDTVSSRAGVNMINPTATFDVTTIGTTSVTAEFNQSGSSTQDILRLMKSQDQTFAVAHAGATTLQNLTDSTAAFRVLASHATFGSGTSVFNVDTTNQRVTIGASDTTGALLVLDTKTGAGDPTGVNGGMYYNSNSSKFRCYQGGAWADCISSTSATTLQTAYDAGNAITSTSARDIDFNMADSATDSSFLVDLQCDTSCGGLGKFAVQDDGTDVFRIDSGTNNGSATFQTSADIDTAFNVKDAAGIVRLQIDTIDDRVHIGDPGSTSNGTLFVLDEASSASNGTDGAMYYSSSFEDFRCYRDGVWQQCNLFAIDRGYMVMDEFIGGNTTGSQIGELGWSKYSHGGGTSNVVFNTGSVTPSSGRPGIARLKPNDTSGVANSVLALALNSNTGTAESVVLNSGDMVRTAVAVGSASSNTQILRVGLFDQTDLFVAQNTGVWWEADPTTNANWRYCYVNASTTVCAASGTAIAANTLVRLQIRITGLGSGTSSAVFTINGTSSTVSGITINTAGPVNNTIACLAKTTTARDCYVDYYQYSGAVSGGR